MDRNTLKKKLEGVWALLERLTVSGENVDLLAAARQELRALYLSAREEEKRWGRCLICRIPTA